MTLLEFMSDSPFLTGFIVIVLGIVIENCVRMVCNKGSGDIEN